HGYSTAGIAGFPPESPNPKLQSPKKLQVPTSKCAVYRLLELGDWCFSGAWLLEFGGYNTSASWSICMSTTLETVKTPNLTLIPHVPAHLIALSKSEEEYAAVSGFPVAPGLRDFLLMASPEFFRSLVAASTPDPWKFGFAIVHTADNVVIGLCGFAGSPGDDGCVEIGYS